MTAQASQEKPMGLISQVCGPGLGMGMTINDDGARALWLARCWGRGRGEGLTKAAGWDEIGRRHV